MLSRTLCLSLVAALASTNVSFGQNVLEFEANRVLGLKKSQVVRPAVVGQFGQAMTVNIQVADQSFALDLHPAKILTDDCVVQILTEDGWITEEPAPVRAMRGSVVGFPGSMVAATVDETGVLARIQLVDGFDYWIQPLAPETAMAGQLDHVWYSSDDVEEHGGTCGADDIHTDNGGAFEVNVGQNYNGAGLAIAEVGCDSDRHLHLDLGESVPAVQNRMISTMNALNIQYESQVGIQHQISHMIVRTAGGPPYQSNNPSTLLNLVRNNWNANLGHIQRDVVHHFSGKSFQGSTIGVAYLGVICQLSSAYGIVENFTGNFSCLTDLSAHELGHNWNAGHCSCGGFTMNPSITCANNFTTGSRNSIMNHRDSRNCLNSGPGGGDPTELFADGFESGSFAAGGWVQSNNRPLITSAAANSGSFGARVRGAVTDIETAVSTVGFADVTLEWRMRTKNLDAGELFYVEWWNGSSWILVESTNTLGWVTRSEALPAAAGNNPNFKIRFRVAASQLRERGDVDVIRVLGDN